MRHQIYMANKDNRNLPPALDIKYYCLNFDTYECVEEAGFAYGKWLLQHASGTWIKGMRRAFAEPTMEVEYEPGGEDRG